MFDIVTSAEVRAIYERAARLQDRIYEEEERESGFFLEDEQEQHRRNMLIVSVIETYRFCAQAIAMLEDPSLGDILINTVGRLANFDDYADGHQQTACRALTSLLKAGLSVDKRIVRLSKDEPHIREAVALGLDANNPAGRVLLDKLAADPVASVRKAAKAALETVAPVPWWFGKWATDPTARLLPEEQESAGPALQRVSELLDLPRYQLFNEPQTNELCAELAKLPAPLVVEAVEHLLSSVEPYVRDTILPLLVLLVERPGGIDALERLIQQWSPGSYAYTEIVPRAVAAAPFEARLAVCQRLLGVAEQASAADRSNLGNNAAWTSAKVVGHAWPPEADVSPVIKVIRALGADPPNGHGVDYVRSGLSYVLEVEGIDFSPFLEEFCEARVNGYKGEWRDLGARLDKLLKRAPSELRRRTAERAIHSEDKETLKWAMTTLLDPDLDGKTDETRTTRLTAMLAEPRLRQAALEAPNLVDRGLPLLREELRRGELSYSEAVSVFASIHRLYGGLAEGVQSYFIRISTADEVAKQRQNAREEIREFLGPEPLQGPPTAEEWQALDRARAAFEGEVAERADLFARSLRPGPWTVEERALLDELFEIARQQEDDPLCYALARAIVAKRDSDMITTRVEELLERASGHLRPMLGHLYRSAREELGLPPLRKKQKASELDDEPQDDDWGDDD